MTTLIDRLRSCDTTTGLDSRMHSLSLAGTLVTLATAVAVVWFITPLLATGTATQAGIGMMLGVATMSGVSRLLVRLTDGD